MEKRKYYETRTELVKPSEPGTAIVIFKTYQAANKYEAIGKSIIKQMPSHAGYYLKRAAAYHTKQKPIN